MQYADWFELNCPRPTWPRPSSRWCWQCYRCFRCLFNKIKYVIRLNNNKPICICILFIFSSSMAVSVSANKMRHWRWRCGQPSTNACSRCTHTHTHPVEANEFEITMLIFLLSLSLRSLSPLYSIFFHALCDHIYRFGCRFTWKIISCTCLFIILRINILDWLAESERTETSDRRTATEKSGK